MEGQTIKMKKGRDDVLLIPKTQINILKFNYTDKYPIGVTANFITLERDKVANPEDFTIRIAFCSDWGRYDSWATSTAFEIFRLLKLSPERSCIYIVDRREGKLLCEKIIKNETLYLDTEWGAGKKLQADLSIFPYMNSYNKRIHKELKDILKED